MTSRSDHLGDAAQRRAYWERTFSDGTWDYLGSIDESARLAVVAGYVVRLVPRGSVLDVGCGEALLAEHLDLSRIRYTGFDVSPTAVRKARDRSAGLDVVAAGVDEFQPRETYDAVVFSEVLATLERPVDVLRRYVACVRPGGYMMVSQFLGGPKRAEPHPMTKTLEDAFAANGWRTIATTDVENRLNGRAWRVYCVRIAPA